MKELKYRDRGTDPNLGISWPTFNVFGTAPGCFCVFGAPENVVL